MNKFYMSKNMKGKESLSDKISTANISEWTEHKLVVSAFFKKLLLTFGVKDKISATFGEHENVLPSKPKMY